MFQQVKDAEFVTGEHQVLNFWQQQAIFRKLRDKNRGKPRWSFLDGPITANNPMGVHHAWGRTYKDCYQRFFAMTGHDQRYQNGFDCQGLWVEVEVEKQLGLPTKDAINEFGIDRFVNECKRRVLKFAARQTEQSVRLGYWMDWDRPDELRKLSAAVGSEESVDYVLPNGETVSDVAHRIVERLGNPEWGGSPVLAAMAEMRCMKRRRDTWMDSNFLLMGGWGNHRRMHGAGKPAGGLLSLRARILDQWSSMPLSCNESGERRSRGQAPSSSQELPKHPL